MALLDDGQRQAFLEGSEGWELDGETIRKTYTFENFVGAMGFVTSVALLAEKAFHHPDIDIRWNRVTLALSTHDQGGLTEKDTDVAAQIDAL
jgi:4a-hydroxytetrahydrobiopterin dehydratase